MRPRQVWVLFAAFLAVVLAGMAWSSVTVLRLERAEVEARGQATLEENARLALWRMDSALTPLLAQESARPYFQYSPFYPAGVAYGSMFAETGAGQPLVPSPLLHDLPGPVLLHFQITPGGDLTSPQAPSGALGARAVAERHTTAALLAERRERLGRLRGQVVATRIAERLPRTLPPAPRPTASPAPPPVAIQKLKGAVEFERRQQTLSQANAVLTDLDARPADKTDAEVHEGAMLPIWAGDALLLARRVEVGGAVYVQGCWLAWPRLRQELLDSIHDLLPEARLESVGDGPAAPNDERRLAALPVKLEPGSVPHADAAGLSPVRLSLAGAWVSVLLAAVSVAALLRGVLDLSERRRVFVSAVTHELRTPLTTFRLYTDMLAEGMVEGEEKRRAYLDRLKGEAERLSHLVENVLFYSRVESGRAGATRERVDVFALVEATLGRLSNAAAAAGLRLVLERAPDVVEAEVDRSALEQVLVNLVDNACKYAAGSEPPVVLIELGSSDGRVRIRVRDHGPGLTRADRRRLFREFSKSDREAARSRPGVGLGLALSRRLMRAQGGDVAIDDTVKDGAAFVITLPTARSAPPTPPAP